MKGRRLFSKKKMTGRTLFFDEKNDGAKTFFGRKNVGADTFLEEKNDGARTFLSEFINIVFLLLMLSCLTLDAECVICLDIVQFTTNHHCA